MTKAKQEPFYSGPSWKCCGVVSPFFQMSSCQRGEKRCWMSPAPRIEAVTVRCIGQILIKIASTISRRSSMHGAYQNGLVKTLHALSYSFLVDIRSMIYRWGFSRKAALSVDKCKKHKNCTRTPRRLLHTETTFHSQSPVGGFHRSILWLPKRKRRELA